MYIILTINSSKMATVSEGVSNNWFSFQKAPYKEYESLSQVPENLRAKAHAYTFGEKSQKKGQTVYRIYYDFPSVYFTGVRLKGEADGLKYPQIEFRFIDDGVETTMGVPFDFDGRSIFYRLFSIAQTNKYFDLIWNTSVTNGEAKFRTPRITGENGRETHAVHEGIIWVGMGQTARNPHVKDVFIDQWNRLCDALCDEKDAQAAKDSFFVWKGNTNEALSKAYYAALDGLVRKHIELLDMIFAKNREQTAALAAPVNTAALPETAQEPQVIDAAQEQKIEANKKAMEAQSPQQVVTQFQENFKITPTIEVVPQNAIELPEDDSDSLPF